MKKLPVLCFVLAGFAVRCDDAYYIVRMAGRRLPLEVYWNVPSMQCRSKGVPFEHLDDFGIIQNEGDSFRGNKMAILYDPGLFPALLKNETSGKFMFRNGGVPQEGSLSRHLDVFRETVLQSIPDEHFDGIAVIDFESWRPILRQNFGELVPYKDISYEIERKKHKWWMESWIKEEAKTRFEESGRIFMQNTISLAKKLRPRAVWGYYGFPYCFNMGADGSEDCAGPTKSENDRLYWLWSESSALYPSVYSARSLTTSQLTSLVRGRIREAARHVRKHSRILPYVWYRHRDGGLLGQKDLSAILETIYKSEASGFIIWGSSSDVNTVAKCRKLHHYIYNVFGPAIANYTKHSLKDDIYTLDLTAEDNDVTNENSVPEIDPESNWIPPVNYTQDIKKYVEDEYKNEKADNMTEIAEEVSLINLINRVYVEKLNHSATNGVDTNSTNQKEIDQIVKTTTEGTKVQTIISNRNNDTVTTTTETLDNIMPSESVINETVLIGMPVSTTEASLPELFSTTEKTSTLKSNDYSTVPYNEETTISSINLTTESSENYETLITNSTIVTESTPISSTTAEYGKETSTYSFEEFDKEFGEDINDFTTTTDRTNVATSTTETTETTTNYNDLKTTTAKIVKEDNRNANNDNDFTELSTRLPETDKTTEYPVKHEESPKVTNSSANQVVIYEVIQD